MIGQDNKDRHGQTNTIASQVQVAAMLPILPLRDLSGLLAREIRQQIYIEAPYTKLTLLGDTYTPARAIALQQIRKIEAYRAGETVNILPLLLVSIEFYQEVSYVCIAQLPVCVIRVWHNDNMKAPLGLEGNTVAMQHRLASASLLAELHPVPSRYFKYQARNTKYFNDQSSSSLGYPQES
ncbi:hypothetical protein FKW77_008376 [Venturia effusa]|uniref:Uncharacterized protein n=1 Tax=Venturia effusa TaxID=50376 RepID=A0A517L9R9_9PEZI|nr:hypothetical protein FKW77_008376 [Venturia effusa]